MQTLKEIVTELTENKINKLKERLNKAEALKKKDKKQFDKHLFEYCKIKANISLVNQDAKTSAFWQIAIALISKMSDSEVFSTETLSKFIEDLETEAKKTSDINILYSILNQLMLEYMERLEQMQNK